ncbi:hypothetical protein PF008_g23169, partial [Phytophthora fragariae]
SAREGTRRSRRTQGVPPEEQLSLEEVERSARQRNAERRKAAREEKESTDAQDARSGAGRSECAPSFPGYRRSRRLGRSASGRLGEDPNSESQGASSPDAPTQASVADAVNVEPPAVDETSGSSRPAQDVVTSEYAGDESAKLTCNEEGPLPDAQEEPTRHVPTEADQPGPDVVPSRLAPRSDAQNLTPESTTAQASRMVIDLTEYA